MGVFDVIRVGEKEGQVKIWDRLMKVYTLEDEVPSILFEGKLYHSYSIGMREGGFVNVSKGTLISWRDIPDAYLVVDKWGREFNNDSYVFQ